MVTALSSDSRWIKGPLFDLGWVFGGAALSLLLVAAIFVAGLPVLAVLWIWLLCFDGPHMAAAYTRTYADRETWRSRPGLLCASLLLFLAGPAALLLSVLSHSPEPFTLFVGAAALYGVYHVIRQHYGFLALYKARNGDRQDFLLDKWCLYLGCWLPYLYFMLTHPRARLLLRLPEQLGAGEHALSLLLIVLWGAVVLTFILRALAWPGKSAHRGSVRLKLAYFLTTVLLYAFAFFVLVRREPVYAASRGPDQDFMLVFAMLTIFHNTEYVGLVWLHNRNRYGDVRAHGLAGRLCRSLPRYLLALGLFSLLIYLAMACSTGVYPGCQALTDRSIGPVTANQLGLCLWWGLGLHHYYIDQRIWRFGQDPALRRSLGL